MRFIISIIMQMIWFLCYI